MGWVTIAAIYIVIWWLVLFAILPIGIRPQSEEGEIAQGTTPSAPVRPMILWKMLATTIISALLLAGLWGLRAAGFTLDDIPFLPRF